MKASGNAMLTNENYWTGNESCKNIKTKWLWRRADLALNDTIIFDIVRKSSLYVDFVLFSICNVTQQCHWCDMINN